MRLSTPRRSVERKPARDCGEGLIEDVDPAQRFFLGEDERRVDANDIGIRHGDEAALQRLMEERARDSLVERLLRLAVGDHLDADEKTAPAHVADEAIFFLQLLQGFEHDLSDARRILDELVLKDRRARADPRRGGERIAAVTRRTAAWLAEGRCGHAIERRGDGAQGKAAADALADRHDVGLQPKVIGSPHLAGAAEADQNFIGDEKRAGLGRDLAHRVDDVVGRTNVAGRALHRLDDDRRELALRVVFDDVAKMLGAGQAARWVLQIEGAAIAVRIGRMMHARRKWPLMIAIAPAQHADDALALAVEATPEADELELLGHRLGKPKGRLDRSGAARKQLQMREPLRQERGDEIEEARPRLSREAAECDAVELLLDPLHIMRVAVTDAADGDAGYEVEIFVAVNVGNGAALGVVDDDLREERNRLQARRHRLGLLIEDR